MVFNTGMSTPKTFGTPGTLATRSPPTRCSRSARPTPCTPAPARGDNPNPNDDEPPPVAAAIASVAVPPGGSAPATIQLPALFTHRAERDELASTRARLVSGATVTDRGRQLPERPDERVQAHLHHQLSGHAGQPGAAVQPLRRLRRQFEQAQDRHRRERQGPDQRHDALDLLPGDERGKQRMGLGGLPDMRDERGFTLVELLVGMAISIVVLFGDPGPGRRLDQGQRPRRQPSRGQPARPGHAPAPP